MSASQFDGTPVVYRCYGRFGVLLYVGMSTRLGRRLAEHKAVSSGNWFHLVREVTVDPFPTVEAAKLAETAAIAAERPLANELGQRSWTAARGRPTVVVRPHAEQVPA